MVKRMLKNRVGKSFLLGAKQVSTNKRTSILINLLYIYRKNNFLWIVDEVQ